MVARTHRFVARERGQATVEQVALVAAVCALLVAVAVGLVAGGAAGAIADRLEDRFGAQPPEARGFADTSRATQAFVLRAVSGGPDDPAPTMADALERLREELPPGLAEAELHRLLAGHLLPRLPPVGGAFGPVGRPDELAAGGPWNGLQPAAGDHRVWSEETPGEGSGSVRIVTAVEEQRLRRALTAASNRRDRAAAIARLGVETAFSVWQPWLGLVALGVNLVEAGVGRTPLAQVPPGLRRDDVLICRPVTRVNRARRREPRAAAVPPLGMPDRAADLEVDRPRRMTRHAVVRSGVVIAEVLHPDADC